jgi:DNA processing protein
LTAPSDLIDRLRLIRTPGIGPIAYRQLLLRFGSAEAALAAIPDLARRGGGRAPVVYARQSAEREIEAVEKLGARYLSLGQGLYPPSLAEVDGAPPLLTVKGDLKLLERPMVAIVGARNASAAACRFARGLAHDLGNENIAVVSGLERGIDSAAHDGSLESGTIAVIAGGIDTYYPPENQARQNDIAARGLLIAEMPPGTEPRARHFPYRNRIIAGLAAGTVVIEAAPQSGSLITARLAADAGREVMAVPGSPLDPRAQGCNQLIRDGATLVQTAARSPAHLKPSTRSRLWLQRPSQRFACASRSCWVLRPYRSTRSSACRVPIPARFNFCYSSLTSPADLTAMRGTGSALAALDALESSARQSRVRT